MTDRVTVFLNPTEAASIRNMSPGTIRSYARSGVIPARKIGKHWRFLESDLLQAGIANHVSQHWRQSEYRPLDRARIARIVKRVRDRRMTQ
jgi:excisionase family DNA binding protein